MKKSILAALMAICLLLTALPMDVMADSASNPVANVDGDIYELDASDEPDISDLEAEGEALLEDAEDQEDDEDALEYDSGDESRDYDELDDVELTDIDVDESSERPGDGSEERPMSDTTGVPAPAAVSGDTEEPVSAPASVQTTPSTGESGESEQDETTAVENVAPQGSDEARNEGASQPTGETESTEEHEEESSKDGEEYSDDAEKEENAGEDESGEQSEVKDADAGDGEEESEEKADAEDGENESEEKTDAEDGENEPGEKADAEDSENESDEKADAEDGENESEEKAENEEGENESDEKADAEAGEDATGEDGRSADEEAADGPLEAQMAGEGALAVNPTSLTMPLQESATLSASGGSGAITWSSENAGVASVDGQGVVSAVAVGSTRIVAADAGGSKAYCEVNIVEVPSDIAFERDSLIIGLKEKRGLPRLVWAGGTKVYQGSATYATSSKKKVTVTADGQIKGVGRGSANIVATLPDGRTLSCAVTVKRAPTRIKVTPRTLSMGVGQTSALGYKLPAACGGTVTWSSSAANVATVNPETGEITAVRNGTAKITARTYNNKRSTATVYVYPAPSSVAFYSNTIAVGLGESVALGPQVVVNDGAMASYSFATADGNIAPVGADGRVTGAALGETQVTVTTYNGLQATATLQVKPAPTGISLPYKTLRIGKGDKVRVQANLGDAASTLSCSSSKKKVVKALEGGILQGVKKGTAYVTVRTYNGLKARLKVVVKSAPTSITANPNPLNLGVGETYTLGYKTPGGTAGTVHYSGDNPAVFSVNANSGEITALAPGSGTVTLTTYNGKSTTCPVTVYAAPTSVAFDPNQVSVAKKQKLQLQMHFNEGAYSNITYESENPGIAKVSATGLVTGVSVGQTVIRARTFVPGVVAETVFTVWGSPSKVWLDQKSMGANVGQTFQLQPRIPVGSQTTFKYKSSNKKIATVSADGVVTPKKKGKVKITVTTHNKKKTTLKLTVADPGKVSSVKLASTDVPVLYTGDTWQVAYVVTPAGADPQLTWTTSNAAVATVNEQGVVSAVGYGQATIQAVSARNKKVSLKFKVSVQTRSLSLTVPERTTDVGGIAANLAMINAIKDSTLYEIDRLRNEGALSGDSASRRKTIVENIFANYAFPWMTTSLQKYWKASYSEGGRKDFKAGRVYYGMPYISGSGANRRYSAALAVAEGRYTDSGQGYYILNKAKYLNGKYVGNDCSGLVNISIWGTDSAHAADRTGDIYSIADYVTIGAYDQMLPGDLLCKNDSHVVMFLYYASSDKSKIMIIENGGSEKGTNTVHCDIKTASAYQKAGYRIRRLASL